MRIIVFAWGTIDSVLDGTKTLTHRDYGGYGQIEIKHKMKKSHRVAWKLTYGPIPQGLCALHYCDNPPCNNPKHLFLGTHKDNATDKVSKGREFHPTGSFNGSAKLTEMQVIAIRVLWQSGINVSELVNIYNITRANIYYILQGKTWRHI
jgi:hypothetical protein